MKRDRDQSPSRPRKKPVTFLGRPLNKFDIDEVRDVIPRGNKAEDRRVALNLAIPNSKKSLKVWDQVVVDDHGRRRFHGAFTGGFSAGHFNTVDTPEGWKPSQFQSSRASRHQGEGQKVQDFMDDEDYENVTSDQTTTIQQEQCPRGFIGGNMVNELNNPKSDELEIFLNYGRDDKIIGGYGLTILKRMGWREGCPVLSARLRRPPRTIQKVAIKGPQRPNQSATLKKQNDEKSLFTEKDAERDGEF